MTAAWAACMPTGQPMEGAACRCVVVDGRWVAVLDAHTCLTCKAMDGREAEHTSIECDHLKPDPTTRHYFDDEAELWRAGDGCAVIAAVCGKGFPARASWFIGSISKKVTSEACPGCLEILKERKDS